MQLTTISGFNLLLPNTQATLDNLDGYEHLGDLRCGWCGYKYFVVSPTGMSDAEIATAQRKLIEQMGDCSSHPEILTAGSMLSGSLDTYEAGLS